MLAKRYREAADNYSYLDQALHEWGTDLSLDNIQLYMLPKYMANDKIGRKDSTMRIGQRIIMMLDSANRRLPRQRNLPLFMIRRARRLRLPTSR